MTIQREIATHCEIKLKTEVRIQNENIREVVRTEDNEKRREQETTGDRVMEISRENVQHDTTRTEEDSVYPRKTKQKNEQKSEKEEEKRVLRDFGTAIEFPIGNALEVSSKIVIEDTLEGEGNTQMQHGHKTPEVKRSQVIGLQKEPLPGRLVNRLSEWRKIWGDTQVSRGIKARWKSPQSLISLEDRKHRKEFRGKTEMMKNSLSFLEEELKEGVVKLVQESEVK
ncbi:uncharacterized protein MONOS_2638 [Monocercomonoides exilis]|uniref:uncharacterized protein n=1 Tax=Monocercomonoides exilis TaxID=2049356 RepID=UPI0035597718|nr:hypothetical protein MONOS_2638 [Monocercomonoides exilis]|eukprot:MONOS_2638.1-p1 / transcript=MONOS_2638.1 / gene=MONOS_2638 / organism=Monocercomonoides_exilis_PA203 / gene_product=unspecified product / transcript_product=unspecified product / location=Mono_scaffold00055:140219-140896(+) / protein_length=226 / sequence_SO=supercontig / SO=protein_coding / is_pseudo=false